MKSPFVNLKEKFELIAGESENGRFDFTKKDPEKIDAICNQFLSKM